MIREFWWRNWHVNRWRNWRRLRAWKRLQRNEIEASVERLARASSAVAEASQHISQAQKTLGFAIQVAPPDPYLHRQLARSQRQLQDVIWGNPLNVMARLWHFQRQAGFALSPDWYDSVIETAEVEVAEALNPSDAEEKSELTPDEKVFAVVATDQEAIRAACGWKPGEDTLVERRAELEPEPDNRHDPDAIRVKIGGQRVGYLSPEDAKELRPFITASIQKLGTALCSAHIFGRSGETDNPRQAYLLVYISRD